jgi:hypothetical protein
LFLEGRGINISTGEISNLSEEFLLRFYVLHKKHSSQMKKIFEKNGGYILHLDGSAESGDEITFTAKDGITGFTIDSWIMPSESCEYIKPFLESLRDKYGAPMAVVRDMADEIAASVTDVFPGVPQQVCQYHFVRNLGGEFTEISKKICDNCECHLDELFVKVIDKNGKEIKIIRHNGLEELNHRWSRMHIRRRTGRSRTTKEMEKYGALFAVFSNIEYEDYIKTVFSDVKDFVREMQNVSEIDVLEARKLIRTFPQCPLIRFDSERPMILKKFIELIGDELDDISDVEIEGWLKNFKTEALLTP